MRELTFAAFTNPGQGHKSTPRLGVKGARFGFKHTLELLSSFLGVLGAPAVVAPALPAAPARPRFSPSGTARHCLGKPLDVEQPMQAGEQLRPGLAFRALAGRCVFRPMAALAGSVSISKVEDLACALSGRAYMLQ
jgi:hypothetical protein